MNSKIDRLLPLVLLLVAGIGIAQLFPFRVAPASASAQVFSGERALAHLELIAREPHPAGSPAQARVRDYLVQQLNGLGLEVELQQLPGIENVVARLRGTNPSGAILLQAHYDSFRGPGAADNGSGVAALLEIMRALAASPAPRNDIIALFDDSEELPVIFAGTRAFIRSHPWMADVRVAVGMDTAVRGFICTDDTGPDNGWMVDVLSRSYTGGAWTSLCGGGNYDTLPFRQAGVRVLELEDNYPFHEQHTPDDLPGIVNPGTLQQLGDQALAVVTHMSSLDLGQTSGEQATYMYVPLIGLLHYPEDWALPLAILAGLLLVAAIGLALWRGLASWRGLGVALLATLVTAVLAVLSANLLWKAAPGLLGWQTQRWSEWPEVIPPNGWLVLLASALLILVLVLVVYRYIRRWSTRASFSLFALLILAAVAVAVAVADRRGAIIVTWPVMLGGAVWIAAGTFSQKGGRSTVEVGALLAAIPTVLYLLPLLLGVFMGDGTKSVAIIAGVWALILGIVLPVVDGWFAQPGEPPQLSKRQAATAAN